MVSIASESNNAVYDEPYVFEIAWEVANKVGGIYTVLKTKAYAISNEHPDRYVLIGPLFHGKIPMEVEETTPPLWLEDSITKCLQSGLEVIFGKWLIEGSPFVVLVDCTKSRSSLNHFKGEFWSKTGISLPPGDHETDDAVIFGFNVKRFFEFFLTSQTLFPVLAHFHEWQAAASLILMKTEQFKIAMVFTTHATILGRYLCAGNADFYNNLKGLDVEFEAGSRNIFHRFSIEKAAAHCAEVFTTVSHVTAFEAEQLLKRKVDGVLPNGLNVVKFSALHQFQNLHALNKDRLHEFVEGHFYGHVDFERDNVLYFFTAGRMEYRNKGVDLFLEALGRLNSMLKQYNSPMTVVSFIIMPAPTNNYNIETLKGQALSKQLKDVVETVTKRAGSRIYDIALRGDVPKPSDLLSEDDIVSLKRRIFAMRRDSLPPIVTHNMIETPKNPIITDIQRLGLFNASGDRVKVVYHPEFLNSNSPVLGLDYEDFVRGCHLGVFPSYYEPWGYTPAECTLLGVPSVTTNLSGFGCFIEESLPNPKDFGIYIVDRRLKSVEESVQQLTEYMFQFCQKSRRQRINLRNRTERLSDMLDWKRLIVEYHKAHQLALARKFPEMYQLEEETRHI